MSQYDSSILQRYVGKTFILGFNEVRVEMLLGGDLGPAFFLCKWVWSDYVYCCEPIDVLVHFDDTYNPLSEFNDFDLDEQ